jgi:predicted nucleotidyltransferase
MRFPITPKELANISKYSTEDINVARKFAKRVHDEFGNFIRAVVIFGSAARKEGESGYDIDVMIIVDDISITLSPELIQTYRIIVEKAVADTSSRIHVTTLKFTSFWEYAKVGDPVAINILRDGVALLDTGFFDPLQQLLLRGRIRPTPEAVWTYYMRSPTTIHNSKWHLMQAVVDLYWAVIDSAHAALMRHGEIPPSPAHAAELMQKKLLPAGMDKKYIETMQMFYETYKKITHREIKGITGKQYDSYLKKAEEFVSGMKKFIEKK